MVGICGQTPCVSLFWGLVEPSPLLAQIPFRVRDNLDSNRSEACVHVSETLRCSPTQVDQAPLDARATIIHTYSDSPSIVQVDNSDNGAKREFSVGRSEGIQVKGFSARCVVPCAFLAVPTGYADPELLIVFATHKG